MWNEDDQVEHSIVVQQVYGRRRYNGHDLVVLTVAKLAFIFLGCSLYRESLPGYSFNVHLVRPIVTSNFGQNHRVILDYYKDTQC